MKKIGIFCSASDNIDKMYFESASQIGKWMGQTGKTLIYGGASLGLMECIARAVKENGGKVIGVVPAKLEENGKVSTLLDEEIHTRNLSDRKDIITEKSEVLVALPGGVGTLDEIFHVIAAASIGYHRKKVIFYNEYGFYDELLKALHTLEDKGFERQPFSTYYEVANTLNELKEKINSIATKIYGADGVDYTPEAEKELANLEKIGFGKVPVCMAKTQYSLTDDQTKLGRPTGFRITVRQVTISAGAGFVVALTGSIMTMPGLSKSPAAFGIDLTDDGKITGLF